MFFRSFYRIKKQANYGAPQKKCAYHLLCNSTCYSCELLTLVMRIYPIYLSDLFLDIKNILFHNSIKYII